MRSYMKLINEIVSQIYREERLQKCLKETIHINQERILILHYVAVNIDRLSSDDIRERAYRYGKMIRQDDLLARQIFLCLLTLADM